MVYHTQNYWVFGFFPSFCILGTTKHDVSETGSVSVLRWGSGKTPTQLGPLERANLNRWTNPVRFTQPFLLSGSPSSAMRFLTHRQDLYDATDSSWVSIRFRSWVFRFYSTDGASGRYYTSSQIVFHFFAMVLIHLGLLARFVTRISTSISILVPRMGMLYHNFYCTFSCYLPQSWPGLRW
jgi:hypothetical protein